MLQSDPKRTLDSEFRLVLEFLCDEFAECSGASDRGFRYAARDRCMVGAGFLSLRAAEARDTIEKLEGKLYFNAAQLQNAIEVSLTDFCIVYINRLVAKHNKKYSFGNTITQSKEGEDIESDDH